MKGPYLVLAVSLIASVVCQQGHNSTDQHGGHYHGQDGHYDHSNDGKGWDIRLSVPGEPEVDYPTLRDIPKTSFTCQEKKDGYYADVQARCQVFRVCANNAPGGFYSFLCPNGTLFNQEVHVCDWWMNVKCDGSSVERYSEQLMTVNPMPAMLDDVQKMISYPMKNTLPPTYTTNQMVMQVYNMPDDMLTMLEPPKYQEGQILLGNLQEPDRGYGRDRPNENAGAFPIAPSKFQQPPQIPYEVPVNEQFTSSYVNQEHDANIYSTIHKEQQEFNSNSQQQIKITKQQFTYPSHHDKQYTVSVPNIPQPVQPFIVNIPINIPAIGNDNLVTVSEKEQNLHQKTVSYQNTASYGDVQSTVTSLEQNQKQDQKISGIQSTSQGFQQYAYQNRVVHPPFGATFQQQTSFEDSPENFSQKQVSQTITETNKANNYQQNIGQSNLQNTISQFDTKHYDDTQQRIINQDEALGELSNTEDKDDSYDQYSITFSAGKAQTITDEENQGEFFSLDHPYYRLGTKGRKQKVKRPNSSPVTNANLNIQQQNRPGFSQVVQTNDLPVEQKVTQFNSYSSVQSTLPQVTSQEIKVTKTEQQIVNKNSAVYSAANQKGEQKFTSTYVDQSIKNNVPEVDTYNLGINQEQKITNIPHRQSTQYKTFTNIQSVPQNNEQIKTHQYSSQYERENSFKTNSQLNKGTHNFNNHFTASKENPSLQQNIRFSGVTGNQYNNLQTDLENQKKTTVQQTNNYESSAKRIGSSLATSFKVENNEADNKNVRISFMSNVEKDHSPTFVSNEQPNKGYSGYSNIPSFSAPNVQNFQTSQYESVKTVQNNPIVKVTVGTKEQESSFSGFTNNGPSTVDTHYQNTHSYNNKQDTNRIGSLTSIQSDRNKEKTSSEVSRFSQENIKTNTPARSKYDQVISIQKQLGGSNVPAPFSKPTNQQFTAPQRNPVKSNVQHGSYEDKQFIENKGQTFADRNLKKNYEDFQRPISTKIPLRSNNGQKSSTQEFHSSQQQTVDLNLQSKDIDRSGQIYTVQTQEQLPALLSPPTIAKYNELNTNQQNRQRTQQQYRPVLVSQNQRTQQQYKPVLISPSQNQRTQQTNTVTSKGGNTFENRRRPTQSVNQQGSEDIITSIKIVPAFGFALHSDIEKEDFYSALESDFKDVDKIYLPPYRQHIPAFTSSATFESPPMIPSNFNSFNSQSGPMNIDFRNFDGYQSGVSFGSSGFDSKESAQFVGNQEISRQMQLTGSVPSHSLTIGNSGYSREKPGIPFSF